jgi:hypothetical protein
VGSNQPGKEWITVNLCTRSAFRSVRDKYSTGANKDMQA